MRRACAPELQIWNRFDMDAILGMLVFSMGGLAGATFLLPARGIRNWAYESWWFVYAFIGLIVCPPVICYFTVPDFWSVVGKVPTRVLVLCSACGAMWGVGALCWGLMVRYLGIGLGLAVGCGVCSGTATLIPKVVKIAEGRFQGFDFASLYNTSGARIVLLGVLLSLVGIVFVGLAGKFKENELPEEEKKKAVAEFDFRKGVVTALMAGVFSAFMNFGLQFAPEMERMAVEAGAKACWGGMPVIMVVLWGGFVVELAWCMQQNFKNRTFGDYVRLPAGGAGRYLANVLLAGSIGVIWVMQFVCTKAGEPMMGDMKYISFAVMMGTTILFSTLIGVFTGEWRGTGGRTKASLALGLVVLVVSFCIISLGSK
ncbi:MAG: hypothetical protein IKO72_16355 [Kiritimatiellae bacterium]|nr:hypothetical protein [Kiritimatiellia bacterium]